MIRYLLAAAVLVAGSFAAPAATADEVATLVNRSNYDIQLYLKWSNLPNESQLIVLRRGDALKQVGPDGAALFVRFNSNPSGKPIELRYRVKTARTSPNQVGLISNFGNAGGGRVDLFLR